MYRGKPSDFNFSAIKYGHTINIITVIDPTLPIYGKKIKSRTNEFQGKFPIQIRT